CRERRPMPVGDLAGLLIAGFSVALIGWAVLRLTSEKKLPFLRSLSVATSLHSAAGRVRPYAAVFAAARTSSSFLIASFLQSLSFQLRNLQSSLSPVRTACHSHWRACSKHS